MAWRMLGWTIDSVLIVCVTLAAYCLLFVAALNRDVPHGYWSIGLVPAIAYLAVESVFGVAMGKWINGTRIVRCDGIESVGLPNVFRLFAKSSTMLICGILVAFHDAEWLYTSLLVPLIIGALWVLASIGGILRCGRSAIDIVAGTDVVKDINGTGPNSTV